MLGSRVDRSATLYLFDPLRQVLPTSTGIPILMYHRVPDVDTCDCHPYYCTSTAEPIFEEQMRFLHEQGYRTITVREAFEAAQQKASKLQHKFVSITFDDGYRDFYTNAFPILNRFGFSATVFLPTAYIGKSPKRFQEAECLTWSEVRQLRRAGIYFGSHTVTHPQLHNINPSELNTEIAESKYEIEQQLAESIESFSYPYAFPEADRSFVSRFECALHATGYREGVSTIIGTVGPSVRRLSMKRIPINTHDDRSFFRAKLEGGYNWLHKAQYAVKIANVRMRPIHKPA